MKSADEFIEFPADKEEHLMNWVLAAQQAFIKSSLFDRNSVLFSPDALIARRLDDIFDMPFDMAFTNREHRRWPINNGVIFLKPTNKKRIGCWWEDARTTCKSYPLETQQWFGDQQALHDLYLQGFHVDYGLNIRMLPCERYNASPIVSTELDDKLTKTAYIVHLKGQRKEMMSKYWDLICSI